MNTAPLRPLTGTRLWVAAFGLALAQQASGRAADADKTAERALDLLQRGDDAEEQAEGRQLVLAAGEEQVEGAGGRELRGRSEAAVDLVDERQQRLAARGA